MPDMRAFIAIPFQLATVQAIQQFVRKQGAAIERGVQARFIPPQNIHLTIRFLGDVSEEFRFVIRDAIRRVADHCPAVEGRIVGLGAFPNASRARVIWVGLDETTGAIERVHKEIEAGLVDIGLDPEDRAFSPHVTIARVKATRHVGELTRVIDENREVAISPCALSEVVLYQSVLGEGGPRYEPLERCPFRGASGGPGSGA